MKKGITKEQEKITNAAQIFKTRKKNREKGRRVNVIKCLSGSANEALY